jgi:hypothetical protein
VAYIVHIEIGNSDDKLTQLEWSKFVEDVHNVLVVSAKIHFKGFASPDVEFQNACWCIELPNDDGDDDTARVRQYLARLARDYGQDSIAWTPGVTEFIKPAADES